MIGEDGWGMTTKAFTPIKFTKYQNEINKLVNSQKIHNMMFERVNNESKIL